MAKLIAVDEVDLDRALDALDYRIDGFDDEDPAFLPDPENLQAMQEAAERIRTLLYGEDKE